MATAVMTSTRPTKMAGTRARRKKQDVLPCILCNHPPTERPTKSQICPEPSKRARQKASSSVAKSLSSTMDSERRVKTDGVKPTKQSVAAAAQIQDEVRQIVMVYNGRQFQIAQELVHLQTELHSLQKLQSETKSNLSSSHHKKKFFESPYKKAEKMEPKSQANIVAKAKHDFDNGDGSKGLFVKRTTYLVKIENSDVKSALPTKGSSSAPDMKLPPLIVARRRMSGDYRSTEEIPPHMLQPNESRQTTYSQDGWESDEEGEEVPPHMLPRIPQLNLQAIEANSDGASSSRSKNKKSVHFAPDTMDINREERPTMAKGSKEPRGDVVLPHISPGGSARGEPTNPAMMHPFQPADAVNKLPNVLDRYALHSMPASLPRIMQGENAQNAQIPSKIRGSALPLLLNRSMLANRSPRSAKSSQESRLSDAQLPTPRTCREELMSADQGNSQRPHSDTSCEEEEADSSMRRQRDHHSATLLLKNQLSKFTKKQQENATSSAQGSKQDIPLSA